MSDTEAILDLGPALLAKKHRECNHPYALVADNEASLTCNECGAELDPWWFLRRQANDEESWRKRYERYAKLEDTARANYEALCRRLQDKIDNLTAEVNSLIKERNRLWNMAIPGDGRPLGSVTRRPRKRRLAVGPPKLSTGNSSEPG